MIKHLFGGLLMTAITLVFIACPRGPEVIPDEPFTCDDIHGQLDFSSFCGLNANVHFSRVNDEEGHCLLQRLFTSPESEWDHTDLITIAITENEDAGVAATLFQAGKMDFEDEPGYRVVTGIGNACIAVEEEFSDGSKTVYYFFYKGRFLCWVDITEMDCLDFESAFAFVQEITETLN